MNESFDDKLMQAARALEKEIRPERDLWPEIRSAIEAPARARVHAAFARAAAVVLLVGASSGLTYLMVGGGGAIEAPAVDSRGLEFQPASFGGHYMLGPDYQDARASVKAQLDAQLEQLEPETRAEVERNLDAIRAAIDEINEALADEPDNLLLQQLLLRSYREELALMTRVDGVANAVMYRTDI